ncbi:MAG: trehalose-phosphatase, partial [Gemmatimonadota bacterium]|nr:trehalose-phosphatase [Gemmatimonadota bacterium]
PLRTRVQTFDVHRWVASFLEQLAEVTPAASRPGLPAGGGAARRELHQRLMDTDSLLLLLDYDGTLVPFTPTPDLARPDREVLALLRALAARPETTVHLVSGRPQDILEEWLGHLPIWLHAEHGFLSRDPDTREWVPAAELGGSWREPVLAILRETTQRTPGSLVEVKAAALAWHYRLADQETGARRANELRLHLNQLLSNQPVEILPGNRVIEIRPYGVHKGRIVPQLSPERQAATAIVAIGDDRTDEDLFNALPPEAITIRVGSGTTRARFRLDGVVGVRQLLRSLLESGAVAVPEQR